MDKRLNDPPERQADDRFIDKLKRLAEPGGLNTVVERWWNRWLLGERIERVMPATLMARVSLTILVPLILVQVISTYVFYDNLFATVSEHLQSDLAGDLAAVSAVYDEFPDANARSRFTSTAERGLGLSVTFE